MSSNPPSSVITFSDADLVRRLPAFAEAGESISLTAKRLLNDAVDQLEQTAQQPVELEEIEQSMTDALRAMRAYRRRLS